MRKLRYIVLVSLLALAACKGGVSAAQYPASPSAAANARHHGTPDPTPTGHHEYGAPVPGVPDRGSPPWRASHEDAYRDGDARTTAHADATPQRDAHEDSHMDAETDSHMDAETDRDGHAVSGQHLSRSG